MESKLEWETEEDSDSEVAWDIICIIAGGRVDQFVVGPGERGCIDK
jgi:hypothetical protein